MLRKIAFVAAFALLPALAMAQQEAGDWEITLNGAGANNNDFDGGSFNVGGSLGYYFTKEMEVVLRQTVGYADFNAGTNWTGSTRVGLDYHFDMGKWQPFIGANIGYVYGDGVNDTWELAPEVGVKFYVHEDTFIFATAEYQWFWDSGDDVDDNFDDGQFVYSLGIGFLLGGE